MDLVIIFRKSKLKVLGTYENNREKLLKKIRTYSVENYILSLKQFFSNLGYQNVRSPEIDY